MQPTGWIFYQSKHCGLPQHTLCDLSSWNYEFDSDFECGNICVSAPILRQRACMIAALEKSAAFHFGLENDQ